MLGVAADLLQGNVGIAAVLMPTGEFELARYPSDDFGTRNQCIQPQVFSTDALNGVLRRAQRRFSPPDY
jgi:hypothetical protein